MTRPKDIIPTQYEVLKLLNGTEVVGMTRDTGNGIEITLPMICKLEVVAPAGNTTLATFYPYAPLSADATVLLPLDIIAHRNNMNEQFVPFYDEASSRWFDMVENKSIPLTGDKKQVRRAYLDRVVRDLMKQLGAQSLNKNKECWKELRKKNGRLKTKFLQTLNLH